MEEWRQDNKCEYCDEVFEKKTRRHKYCSGRCKEAHRIAKLDIHIGTCPYCGESFKYKIKAGRPTLSYCSVACQLKATVPIKMCKCVDCKTEFKFKGRTTKLRCDTCWNKHRSKQVMTYRQRKDPSIKLGVGSGGGQNMDKDINTNTHEQIKAARRAYYNENADKMRSIARARYRSILTGADSCSLCGYTRYQNALVVHHKNMNRDDNDLTNLSILCANCHMHLHKDIRKRQKAQGITAEGVYLKHLEAESKERN